MLKRPPSKCQTPTRRQQHRAGREKAGIDMLGLPTRTNRVIGYLLATERIDERRALNLRSVRAAIAKLLDDLTKLTDDPRAVARMIETLQRHLHALTRE